MVQRETAQAGLHIHFSQLIKLPPLRRHRNQSKAKNWMSLKISVFFLKPPLNALWFLFSHMHQKKAIPIALRTSSVCRIPRHISSTEAPFTGHQSTHDQSSALAVFEVDQDVNMWSADSAKDKQTGHTSVASEILLFLRLSLVAKRLLRSRQRKIFIFLGIALLHSVSEAAIGRVIM